MKGKATPPPDYKLFNKKLPKNFLALVKERREISDMEKTLKARADEISSVLVPAMMVVKQKSLLVDGRPVTLCTGRRSRIDGRILLEKGVGSDVIQAATVTKEYNYVTTGGTPAEDDVNV